MKKVTLVLENERPKSWNKYWSGMHWADRNEERNRVHQRMRELIDPDTVEIFEVPITITITAYFKNKPQDASNVSIKPYEDSLIGWFIEDDGPDYVKAVTTKSRVDRDHPRVEIELEEYLGEDYPRTATE